MKKLWKENTIFIVCFLVSVVLFGIFIALQLNKSTVLDINTRWLITAGIPILVGLIIGGYVTKFKGFGVELETRLKSPVTILSLKAADAITFLPGDEKQSAGRLRSVSEAQIIRTKRLSFVTGRKSYYGIQAIIEYLRTFRNLEYFEIKKESNEFVCLIPIDLFRRLLNSIEERLYDYNYNKLDNFINQLEKE